jgi:lysophospholipase L1-like esterase
MQRTILCYGDSNTWGYVPLPMAERTKGIKRYSKDERWTGIIQKELGSDYLIVEEGLNSRTTNLEYPFPPDRNGKTYLPPCLYSHAPIDLVILALGGNDLKASFNREPLDIQEGLIELIDIIQSSAYGKDMLKAPQILIIPVSIPHSLVESSMDENGIIQFKGAIDKAKTLIGLYAETAVKKQCHFIDTTKSINPSSIDGLHLNKTAHKKLAKMLHQKIIEIFEFK